MVFGFDPPPSPVFPSSPTTAPPSPSSFFSSPSPVFTTSAVSPAVKDRAIIVVELRGEPQKNFQPTQIFLRSNLKNMTRVKFFYSQLTLLLFVCCSWSASGVGCSGGRSVWGGRRGRKDGGNGLHDSPQELLGGTLIQVKSYLEPSDDIVWYILLLREKESKNKSEILKKIIENLRRSMPVSGVLRQLTAHRPGKCSTGGKSITSCLSI